MSKNVKINNNSKFITLNYIQSYIFTFILNWHYLTLLDFLITIENMAKTVQIGKCQDFTSSTISLYIK